LAAYAVEMPKNILKPVLPRPDMYEYLCQVLLNDIVPHLRGIKLSVKSCSNHGHNVIDAAQTALF